MLRLVAGALVLLLSAGCAGGGSDSAAVRLDGSPRFPDDEGVVTAISFERITLDGKRSYDVSDELLAFSTSTRELEPMLGRRNQYVQVGLDGDTMVWMAGFAVVVRVPGDQPAVYYRGELARRDGDELVFRDGTVLRLDEGVSVPKPGPMLARIDPAKHRVVALQARR